MAHTIFCGSSAATDLKMPVAMIGMPLITAVENCWICCSDILRNYDHPALAYSAPHLYGIFLHINTPNIKVLEGKEKTHHPDKKKHTPTKYARCSVIFSREKNMITIPIYLYNSICGETWATPPLVYLKD